MGENVDLFSRHTRSTSLKASTQLLVAASSKLLEASTGSESARGGRTARSRGASKTSSPPAKSREARSTRPLDSVAATKTSTELPTHCARTSSVSASIQKGN